MTHTAEEVRDLVGRISGHAITVAEKAEVLATLTAYAAVLERRAAGVTEEVVERACKAASEHDDELMHGIPWPDGWPEDEQKGVRSSMRAALLAVWPVAAEPAQDKCFCDRMYPDSNPNASCGDCPTRDYKAADPAQPVERRWTGPGYLEQTGYIDPQPGEHVSDAESLLRSAAQKAVRANFDLRVRNNEIVGLLSEVLGFIGNVTDDERDIANRITKCLGATFVTEPLRPGYVRCQKCEAQMGGYGYGKFPKLCPVCQDISIKPAEPAQPADSGRAMDALRDLVEVCEAEFCGGQTDTEPDNSKVAYPEDECPITFGHIRRARAALAAQGQPAERVPEVVTEVLAELDRAMRKFPTWPTDPLHAVAVLNEEVGELNKAVLQQIYEPSKNPLGAVYSEAVQAAAMALRFVASINEYTWLRSVQHKQPMLAALQPGESS